MQPGQRKWMTSEVPSVDIRLMVKQDQGLKERSKIVLQVGNLKHKVQLTTVEWNWGERVFFECKGCRGLRNLLYQRKSQLLCKQCHHLAHPIQNETPTGRLLHQRDKLCSQLGILPGEQPPKEKPKFMRWKRFAGLINELRIVDKKLIRHFDRKLAHGAVDLINSMN